MTIDDAYRRLAIGRDFIPPGSANRSARPLIPSHITIHNTANPVPGADAIAHGRYLRGAQAQRRRVSWHFTVDDKRCVKHLPLAEQGSHTGSREGNRASLGIEICEHAGIDQAAADRRAALLVAALMRRFRIPLENVVPHRRWTGKNCPRLLLAGGGDGWRRFLGWVERSWSQIEGT